MICDTLNQIKTKFEIYKQYVPEEDKSYFDHVISLFDWYLKNADDVNDYNYQLLSFLEIAKQYRTKYINQKEYLFDEVHPEYKDAVELSQKLKIKTMTELHKMNN